MITGICAVVVALGFWCCCVMGAREDRRSGWK